MSVPKKSVKLGLVAAAVTGLALTAFTPALAVDGGPSTTPNLGVDIIGVGSDTTQWAMDAIATSYDAAITTGPRLINYDACLGNTQPDADGLGSNPDGSGFPCGGDNTGTKAGIPRPESDLTGNSADTGPLPNGSGAGRNLLMTPADTIFNDVAFARSSSAISIANLNAGLVPLPFAVDKFVSVVSPIGPAPRALSGQQILKIFNGTYTNWNQVGGKNAPIHPYLPKSTSGTYNSSLVFLAALDGVTEAPGSDNDQTSHSAAHQTWQGPGVTITDANWNTGTVPVEEHDPSIIQADPDAIQLFSYGRAQMANKTSPKIRIEGGWSEDRELYNVVRGKTISGAAYTPFIYGDSDPLHPANGDGQAVSDPGGILESIFGNAGWICTSDTARSDMAGVGFWPLNSNTCGKANNSTFDTINPFHTNGVGEGASTTTSALYSHGRVEVGVVASDASVPTGKVQVVIAKSVAAGQPAPKATYVTTATLDGNGHASVTVPSTVTGAQTVDVSYLPTDFGSNGDAGHAALGSSYATPFPARFPAAKVATTLKASANPTRLANATKRSKVTATVVAKSGSKKPTGTVKIMLGTKVLTSLKVKATSAARTSRAVLTVKGSWLKRGKNHLLVKFVPTGNFKAPAKSPTVTITRVR